MSTRSRSATILVTLAAVLLVAGRTPAMEKRLIVAPVHETCTCEVATCEVAHLRSGWHPFGRPATAPSATTAGPPLFDLAEALGREETARRLDRYRTYLRALSAE